MSSTEKEVRPDYSQTGWGNDPVKKKGQRPKIKRSSHRCESAKVELRGSRANGLFSNRLRQGSATFLQLTGRVCKSTSLREDFKLDLTEFNQRGHAVEKLLNPASYIAEHEQIFEISTDKVLLLSRVELYEQAKRDGRVKVVVKGDERFKGFD